MTTFIQDKTPSIQTVQDIETFDFNGQQMIDLIVKDANDKGITGTLVDSAVHYAKRSISPLNYAQDREDIKGFISKRKSLKVTSMFEDANDSDKIYETEMTIVLN